MPRTALKRRPARAIRVSPRFDGDAERYAPERCLQLATAAGACCVTAYDALSGLLPFEEMERRIDAGWAKLPLENPE